MIICFYIGQVPDIAGLVVSINCGAKLWMKLPMVWGSLCRLLLVSRIGSVRCFLIFSLFLLIIVFSKHFFFEQLDLLNEYLKYIWMLAPFCICNYIYFYLYIYLYLLRDWYFSVAWQLVFCRKVYSKWKKISFEDKCLKFVMFIPGTI